MLTAAQRYNQAMAKVRIKGRRDVRRFMEGLEPICYGWDERGAIINELERAYKAGFADGQASLKD